MAGRKKAFCTKSILSGDERVESALNLPAHTATRVGTSDFQAELLSKLLLTGTHLRKQAVATLSYSPAGTHPQVIYTITFPAGLNGVEVD